MSHETITAYFEKDHDRLDELFESFQENKHKDFSKARQCFKEFLLGLLRHIRWEEELLFTLFEEKTGNRDSGPTFVMRQEHEEIIKILDAIHEKVGRGSKDSQQEEQRLLDILTQHNLKEENILYPSLDEITSEEDRRKMFDAMKEISLGFRPGCCGMTE